MNDMKTRLSLFAATLMLALTGSTAQTFPIEKLNPNMQRFYKGCMALRQGVIEKNAVTLDRAIDLLDEDPTNPDHIELYNLKITDVDTLPQLSTKGRFVYTADYADYFKETMGQGVYVEKPEALRNYPTTCQIAHRAIKPNGKVAYRALMSGDCRVFALAAPEGALKLTVTIDGETVPFTGESYESGALSFAMWEMPPFPAKQVTLTIENTTNQALSFVLVSN